MHKATHCFMHCLCSLPVYIPYIFQFLYSRVIFFIFLQKNNENLELSSLVPAAAEPYRYRTTLLA